MADGSWLGALVDAMVGLIDAIGPAGAGLAVALENLFPPVPSEAILPIAGLAASRGSFTVVEAIAWTTAGSVVGALALYALGAWLGLDRLRRVAERMPLVDAADVDHAVGWFRRHGGAAVFFGRMVPVFRSVISIPAGVARMPLWRFGLLTAAGSAVWNTAFVLVGFLLGEAWPIVERYVEVVQWAVIGVVAVAVVWFLVVRIRRSAATRRAAAARRVVMHRRAGPHPE